MSFLSRRQASLRPFRAVCLIEPPERRALLDGEVVDAPVEDPAVDVGAESSYPYPPPPPANRPPSVTVDHASVTADEGSYAINSGTFSDLDYDIVTMSASLGSAFGSGSSGNWRWSYTPPDGHVPPLTQPVTVTATDSRGLSSQVEFSLTANNVAPQFTLSGPSEVIIGESYQLGRSSITDPGQDTISSWTIAWGDGSTETFAGNPSTFSHIYAAPPGTKGVTATANDEDGACTRNAVVQVKPPTVGVTGGSYASENGPRATAFTVTRNGPVGAPLVVHFTLSGSAVPGTGAPGEAVSPANADYRVSAAEKDGAAAGAFRVTIPANTANVLVMATPVNDSGEEPVERITLTITPPAAGTYAVDPDAAAANADLVSNKVRLGDEADPLLGTPPTRPEMDDVNTQLRRCADADETVRVQGTAALRDAFRLNPALMQYADSEAPAYGPEAERRSDGAVADVTAELKPFTVTLNAGPEETSVSVELAPVGTQFADLRNKKIRVFVYFDDPAIIHHKLTMTAKLYYDVDITARAVPKTIVIPLRVGTTKLRVMQQFRHVHPDTGEETIVGQVRNYARDAIVSENLA